LRASRFLRAFFSAGDSIYYDIPVYYI